MSDQEWADAPFDPVKPQDAEPDPPRPAIGDCWCLKQYAGIGNSSIGRVDVTDMLTVKGEDIVRFEPRYGERKPSQHTVEVFLKRFVPRALVPR
jgi:hypothetical protein